MKETPEADEGPIPPVAPGQTPLAEAEESEEEQAVLSYRGPLLSNNSFQYRDDIYRYDGRQWFRGTVIQGRDPVSFELVPTGLQEALTAKYKDKLYTPTEQRVLENLEKIARGKVTAGSVLPGEDIEGNSVLKALHTKMPELGGRSLYEIVGDDNVNRILASGVVVEGSTVQRVFNLARDMDQRPDRQAGTPTPAPSPGSTIQRLFNLVRDIIRRLSFSSAGQAGTPARELGKSIRQELDEAIRAARASGEKTGKTSSIMACPFSSLGDKSLNDLFPKGSPDRIDIAGRIHHLVTNKSDPRYLASLLDAVTEQAVAFEIKKKMESARKIAGEGKTKSVMHTPIQALGGVTLQNLLPGKIRDRVDEAVMGYVNHRSTPSDSKYSDPILRIVRASVRGETDTAPVPPIGQVHVVRGHPGPMPAPPVVHGPPQQRYDRRTPR